MQDRGVKILYLGAIKNRLLFFFLQPISEL